MRISTYLKISDLYAAAGGAVSFNRRCMTFSVRNGSIHHQYGARIIRRISHCADLLIWRGEQERGLQEILSGRTQLKNVTRTGGIEEGIQPVCNSIGGVWRLAFVGPGEDHVDLMLG